MLFFPFSSHCLLVVLGWLTPLGPLLTVLSSFVAITFLAWDNTDLIPARQLMPFKYRFRFLLKTLPFHLGFGLWFLIPVLNILFLVLRTHRSHAVSCRPAKERGLFDQLTE